MRIGNPRTLEDIEIFISYYDELISFKVAHILQESSGEECLITLTPTQSLLTQAPHLSRCGCNACELDDDGLAHKPNCSMLHFGAMVVKFVGEIDER